MASALFKLSSDGGSNYLAAGTAMADANALAYVSSSTYSMKAALDSTSGVSSVAWAITSADDAHAASLPTVTTAADKTCTFTVPKTGGAWLLRCTVNGGVNAQGNADTSLVRSLAIKVLNANGQQEVAVGETSEAGTYGWTKAINDIGRTAGLNVTESWGGQEQGFGTDGAVSYSAGGAASALTAPMYATDLTISPNGGTPTTLSMAAYPVMGTGTLTLGTNCVLHHNGTSVAANTQAGGTAAATGHLGNTQQAGANGGAINSSGGNATTQSNALGAAGGSGGKGSQPGGTSPAATFPVASSVGRWINSMFLFCLSGSFTKPAGGGGGSSGGGDADSVGSGGGSGGGVAKVTFKSIVMGSGAKISCDGGAGGSNSNGAGGGGGGGGGYLEVHCDELTMTTTYADHFTCAGGAGGTATGGGVSGSAGSAGRVRVFLRGKRVYST